MSDPTDKIRVVRLIKKPEPPKPEAPTPPPPPPQDEAAPGPRQRKSPPFKQGNRPRWKKKPFQKRSGPHQRQAPRRPESRPVVLTNEQRNGILETYRGMVVAGERPPEGRRKKIAAMFGVPYAKVAEVVRAYLTHERYRRTNFEIEKAYWQAVRGGETDARSITRQIAEKFELDEGRIAWWLEKLHEPRKAFEKDPEVEDEKRSAILAAYETYLQQPEPPEKGLHQSFAEQVGGVTSRQVHKVLWENRMSVWTRLQNTERTTPSESTPADQSE